MGEERFCLCIRELVHGQKKTAVRRGIGSIIIAAIETDSNGVLCYFPPAEGSRRMSFVEAGAPMKVISLIPTPRIWSSARTTW